MSACTFKIQKNKPCQNCDPIIILLTQQINELNQRESNLQKVNQTLTKALTKSKQDSQKQFLLKVDWKNKYEEEISRGHQLEKQLKMLSMEKAQIYSMRENRTEQLTTKVPFRNCCEDKQNCKRRRRECECEQNYHKNNQAYDKTAKKQWSNYENKRQRALSLRQVNQNEVNGRQTGRCDSRVHSLKQSCIETSLRQSRKKSMKKMQCLMETIIKKRRYEEQMQQFFEKKVQQNSGNTLNRSVMSSNNLGVILNNNQIVLRIIDQRRKGQRNGFRI